MTRVGSCACTRATGARHTGAASHANVIQAHTALERACYSCEEGGRSVLVAECPDGVGRADPLKWYDAANPHSSSREFAASYEVNGQTAWSLLTKAERFHIQ